ncbi:type II toxin-antitoxin system RelE family toxin [Wolbachia endosymbiont (group B) of Longitarsus flavicornis]|uniref:type II toxin-antitoxin system RelE family toxin n=1 Tax=Wolbachia endosymbiont (group B) of Longitarsus flavicornis TaxID=3066135 RepID=UPI00334082D4
MHHFHQVAEDLVLVRHFLLNLCDTHYEELWGSFRRLRVGDYRIMYCADTTKHEVTIVTIGHRDTIYEKALKVLKNYVFQ